nr:tetratricopeptide repeat protein [Rhodoferax sp.]
MNSKNLVVILSVAWALGGCASTPLPVLPPPAFVWQDAAFNYDRSLVTETRDALFALDPEVVQNLRMDDGSIRSAERRLNKLLARLYGPNGIQLSYATGHTTGASDTWHNKRGDCLSLTILAYASARFLGIDARMQEVQVPVAVDRRDGVEFISGHVNVLVRNESEVFLNGQVFGVGSFVIDFEPQVGSRRTGQWLSEAEILARFYNNRGTEYLVQKDDARAYAYYRAAIEAAPGFAPASANLAQLYVRRGLLPGAEQLLRHAIALGGPSYLPMRNLHQLLLAQGRTTEAQHYAQMLEKRQDEDPYYWLSKGIVALRDGRLRAAVSALERAESLTSGFEEIHYHLALAYARNGQREAAKKQLVVLTAIDSKDPGVALLSRKFSALALPTAMP